MHALMNQEERGEERGECGDMTDSPVVSHGNRATQGLSS